MINSDNEGVGQYEVLEEMFQMWRQADEKLSEAKRTLVHLELFAVKNTWEQAIMVYTGWRGDELKQWLEEKQQNCSRCGQPWQAHYDPENLKFKNGPFGTFGLVADHTPHIPGIHAERKGG